MGRIRIYILRKFFITSSIIRVEVHDVPTNISIHNEYQFDHFVTPTISH